MAPLVMSRGGTGQRPDWTSWCGVQVHSHRMHLSRLVPSLSRIPVRASMGMTYLELELAKTSSARMECELLDFLSVQQKKKGIFILPKHNFQNTPAPLEYYANIPSPSVFLLLGVYNLDALT